jgi:hypothetical protein
MTTQAFIWRMPEMMGFLIKQELQQNKILNHRTYMHVSVCAMPSLAKMARLFKYKCVITISRMRFKGKVNHASGQTRDASRDRKKRDNHSAGTGKVSARKEEE